MEIYNLLTLVEIYSIIPNSKYKFLLPFILPSTYIILVKENVAATAFPIELCEI